MSFSVSGKTAIVTGSASGIGLAIARHLLDKSANVMFADVDEDRLEAEVGEEARAEGPVRMFSGDLTEKLTIANLLSATVDAFDRVDILVNANRRMAVSEILNPEADGVEELWRHNVLSALRISQMTAKRMIQHGQRAEVEPGPMPWAPVSPPTPFASRRSTACSSAGRCASCISAPRKFWFPRYSSSVSARSASGFNP